MLKTLKKSLKKLGIALATVGAFSLGSGCEFFTPEGVLVKAKADGVISQEEEQAIIDIMGRQELAGDECDKAYNIFLFSSGAIPEDTQKKCFITDFEGPMQGLVNDSDIFFAREFSGRGFSYHEIEGGQHIYLTKDKEELKKKHRETTLNDMPSWTGGFNVMQNSTIYLPKTYGFGQFYRIFEHEIGHSMRHGAYEYASMANEIYSDLKLYALNRNLGARNVGQGLCDLPREKAGSFSEGFTQYYDLGCLNFFVQANLHDGSLEAAHNHIMNAPGLHLEEKLVSIANQYEDMREAFKDQLEQLVQKPGFRESFSRLGDEEFAELSDYLAANIHFTMEYFPGFIETGEERHFDKLAEDFLANHKSPYFRADIIHNLTLAYMANARMLNDRWMANNVTPAVQDIEEMYSILSKAIGLNKQYPCKYDFSSCPTFLAGQRSMHAKAYSDAMWFGLRLIGNGLTPDDLINRGLEFNAKFYPRGDYSLENNDWDINFYGAWTNFWLADAYRQKTWQSLTWADFVKNCNEAKKWYETVKAATSCENIAVENKEDCGKQFDDFGGMAQKEIDKLGYCKE